MVEQNYVELQVITHFSFLRGASSCEELFVQAATLGIPHSASPTAIRWQHRARA
jgi:DNA polymerase III alpha subunit